MFIVTDLVSLIERKSVFVNINKTPWYPFEVFSALLAKIVRNPPKKMKQLYFIYLYLQAFNLTDFESQLLLSPNEVGVI